jgi:hypothetical protein
VRRAVITINWEGPDKKVRELIDNAVDDLFMEITFLPAVVAGDTAIEFTSRVKS